MHWFLAFKQQYILRVLTHTAILYLLCWAGECGGRPGVPVDKKCSIIWYSIVYYSMGQHTIQYNTKQKKTILENIINTHVRIYPESENKLYFNIQILNLANTWERGKEKNSLSLVCVSLSLHWLQRGKRRRTNRGESIELAHWRRQAGWCAFSTLQHRQTARNHTVTHTYTRVGLFIHLTPPRTSTLEVAAR